MTSTEPLEEVPVIAAGSPGNDPAKSHIRRRAVDAASGEGERGRGGLMGRLGHLTGLDGLRAIAVVAVLLYHADLDILPAGFLGVDVFFVISGYLITALLLREWSDRDRISLIGFWFRRARRLLPAVFVLLAGVVVFSLVVLPDEVARLRSDAAAALTYITNWYLIFHEQSYFEAVGRPSPLGHLWSLAVEEQFYLLWPPILVGLLVVLRRQGALLVTLTLAWASAIWMAVLFNPDVDPSRVYFGTDTRAFTLLVGAALAFVWVPTAALVQASRPSERPRAPRSDVIAVAGLAGLVLLFITLTAYDEILYRGGFQLVAILTALVIAAVVRPGSHVGQFLDRAPIRWVGVRSYSIYLWHWPVFVVTRPGIDIPLDAWAALVLRLAITLVLADLSYRLIERPIRGGALGRLWAGWTSRQRSIGRDPRWSAVPAGLFVAILVAAVSVQVLAATPAQAPSYFVGTDPASVSQAGPDDGGDGDTAAVTGVDDLGTFDPNDPNVDPNLDVGDGDEPVAGEDALGPEDPGDGGQPGPAVDPSAAATPAPTARPTVRPTATRPSATAGTLASPSRAPAAIATPKPTAKPTPKPTAKPAGRVTGKVLALGDSVMLGATRALRRQFASIEVNATTSRQFNDGIRVLRSRAAAGTLPNVVVIHLGTNGPITKRQFDLAMAALKNVRLVVFVNVKVPRPWEGYTNRTLSQNVRRYDNAVLVDWRGGSADVDNAFARDGIHLNSEGALAYARLIADAIR